ncbi:MAG TPA: chemotaxis protein CheB [Burkholderiales bacterium]|nr:chemotaxis protein CheB [Burkholderiales bacterium]
MTARKNKTAAKKPQPASAAEPIAASRPERPDKHPFPIVGIGASAGGLAAFEAFFSNMPGGSGMAFVIVQHLAPDHKSMLKDLIGRYTEMQVLEADDGMTVRPNCTYIIPPNHDLSLLDGRLQLLEPGAPRGQRLPVDFFFRSLAADQRTHAIGIVLSGTGSDGTQGVRAIKGEGGLVMAQTFETTQYEGMPRSAVATGMVDFVLPPGDMPAELVAYVRHAFGGKRAVVPDGGLRIDEALNTILVLLRAQTGHDFSGYKPSTVNRRVERRMAIHQIDRANDYAQYLKTHPSDVDALFRDLLIGVTDFFRDKEAFGALEEEAVVRLLSNKPAGTNLRVWVPGCSSGEEAYSIGILLQERMHALKTSFKLIVFATDIDARAIDQARAGVYPASVLANVSPERLKRYFTEEPGGGFCRINKTIREMIVFSEHDLIRDPPFSRLDLISCRNLLIYMGTDLHRKLIPLFHYALNPGGFLFLGTSESIGDHAELFSTLNRAARLYQRRDDAIVPRVVLGRSLPTLGPGDATPRTAEKPAREAGVRLRELTERALLLQYAPAAVLVNDAGDILYLHGRTGDYLEPATGEPGMNIVKMARQGLRRALTTALRKAVTSRELQFHSAVLVKTNGDFSSVDLSVRPLPANADGQLPLFLVMLEQASQKRAEADGTAAGKPSRAGAKRKAGGNGTQVEELKRELQEKEDYLQVTTEQLETTNEELKSANEELQSINEEMQSTNEELETSREELQSVNEELATVNAELQNKVTDLSQANNDMNNLLAGTGVGTVFVDHRLHITRFTPSITQVINLIPTDVGRPVGHIVSNLESYDYLVQDVQRVLDTLVPKEVEVKSLSGRWFVLRINPYRTLENVIEGAVITFFDITVQKRAREALEEAEALRRLANISTDSSDAMLVQDLDGRILGWNPAASRLYGWSEAEARKMNIRELIPPEQQDAALAAIRDLSQAKILQPLQTQRLARDGRLVPVWLTATALVNTDGAVYAVASTERAAT